MNLQFIRKLQIFMLLDLCLTFKIMKPCFPYNIFFKFLKETTKCLSRYMKLNNHRNITEPLIHCFINMINQESCVVTLKLKDCQEHHLQVHFYTVMPWSHCPIFKKIGSSAEIWEVGIEIIIQK